MVRYTLYVLLALAGLLLQATILPHLSPDVLKPDLAFLVVVYMGLHRPVSEGSLAVVVIAYLADRFTALPSGTFLLLYLVLFYVASGTSKVFYFRGTGFPALMTFALSMLYAAGLTVMVGYGRGGAEAFLNHTGLSLGYLALFSLLNVLASWVVFRICRMIDGEKLRAGRVGLR